MAEITRTLKFEVVFPSARRCDLIGEGGLFEKLWGAMDDLTTAANRTVSTMYLLHTGAIEWPVQETKIEAGPDVVQPEGTIRVTREDGSAYFKGAKKTHPLTLAYQCFSGKWMPAYTAMNGPEVSGGVKSAMASVVCDRVVSKRQVPGRKKALPGWLYAQQGHESLPTFRRHPIPFRNQEVEVTKDGRIMLRTWAGRSKPVIVAPMRLDSSRRAIFDRIIDGTYKQGGAKLIWDQSPGRKGKWFISIAWTGPVEEKQSNRVAAIHFGVFCAAYVLVANRDGSKRDAIERVNLPRNLVRAYDRAFAERRALLTNNRQAREQRAGRGRDRKLRVVSRFGDHLQNIADTAVQQAAAAIVKTAIKRGASVLYLPDVKGEAGEMLDETEGMYKAKDRARARRIWFTRRHGMLRTAVQAAAAREGLTVVDVPRHRGPDDGAVAAVLDGAIAPKEGT